MTATQRVPGPPFPPRRPGPARRWLSRAAFALVIGAALLIHGVAAVLSFGPETPDQGGLAEPATAPAAAFTAPGPYAVGTRTLGLTADDRALALVTWYPARVTSGAPRADNAIALRMAPPLGTVALAVSRGSAVAGADALPRPPAGAPTSGGWPLVVLSPGFAFSSTAYGWLAEHLASHGFVVVGIEHAEWLDPGRLWAATVDRPADVRALLTALAGPSGAAVTTADAMPSPADDRVAAEAWTVDDLAGIVDSESVAVLGHSYGGYTALAAAGARFDTGELRDACTQAALDRDPVTFLCDALEPRLEEIAARAGLPAVPGGAWPSWSTAGVDAAVALAGDAVMFGPAGLAGIRVPVLAIGGTADVDAPFRWGTQLAYEASRGARRVEVALPGAEHLVFTGRCDRARRLLDLMPEPFCRDPAWERGKAHAAVRGVVTAFLRAELLGDPAAARWLADPGKLTGGPLGAATYREEGYTP